MLPELKIEIKELSIKIQDLSKHIDIEPLKIKKNELEVKSSANNLWDDPSAAQSVLSELKYINDQISFVESIKKDSEDLENIVDMAISENDNSIESHIIEEFENLKKKVQKMGYTYV